MLGHTPMTTTFEPRRDLLPVVFIMSCLWLGSVRCYAFELGGAKSSSASATAAATIDFMTLHASWGKEQAMSLAGGDPGSVFIAAHQGSDWLVSWSDASLGADGTKLPTQLTLATVRAQAAMTAFLKTTITSEETFVVRRTVVQGQVRTERTRSSVIRQRAASVIGPVQTVATWYDNDRRRAIAVIAMMLPNETTETRP